VTDGSTAASGGRALSGVRVLDLTRFPPGQFCTVMLADLGADVVRVDAPGWNPMFAGVGTGIGRAKRSVALDLRNPSATGVLRRLAAWADVVVDNNRPGDLDDRGFGPRAARTEDPSLIWCSITGYGQDGPYARFAGHDLTYTARSGLLAAVNPELPWYPQLVLSLPIAALMATTAITTALYDRERTGAGAHLDISMSESASWLLSGAEGQLTDTAFAIPISASRRLYRCADGRWVSVAADEPRSWAALCRGLGLADLADERPADQDDAARRIGEVFATRPAAAWVAELGPLGTTVDAVHEGSTLVDDPQVVARGAVVEVGGQPVPANPIRINGPGGARSGTVTTPPAPAGTHTDEVLAEAGFTAEEIAELRSSGAFGAPG
jgi:crotonobetainyl-CoA:carnitine CoA-transferase CaiB-like acyl-CoA transferase